MPFSFRVGILDGCVGFWVIKKAFTEWFGADWMDLDAILPKANVAPTDQITGVGMGAGEGEKQRLSLRARPCHSSRWRRGRVAYCCRLIHD